MEPTAPGCNCKELVIVLWGIQCCGWFLVLQFAWFNAFVLFRYCLAEQTRHNQYSEAEAGRGLRISNKRNYSTMTNDLETFQVSTLR